METRDRQLSHYSEIAFARREDDDVYATWRARVALYDGCPRAEIVEELGHDIADDNGDPWDGPVNEREERQIREALGMQPAETGPAHAYGEYCECPECSDDTTHYHVVAWCDFQPADYISEPYKSRDDALAAQNDYTTPIEDADDYTVRRLNADIVVVHHRNGSSVNVRIEEHDDTCKLCPNTAAWEEAAK